PRDRARLDRSIEDEITDEPVDLDRVAALERVPATFEGDQSRAGDRLRELPRVVVGNDLVLRAVEHQGRGGDAGQDVVHAGPVDRAERLDSTRTSGVVSPAHANMSSMPLSECGSWNTRL